MNIKKLTPILLIVGLVAIAAIVIIQVTRDSESPKSSVAPPTLPQLQQQKPANVGPDTLLPDGTSQEDYVKKYYTAIKKKDYQTAYDMQPASKKATADLDGFKQAQESYGIESFEIGKSDIQGDSATLEVKLNTGKYGIFTTSWVFAKKNGKWVADSTRTIIK